MPARDDFGILRARAVSDPRTLRASELYVERKIAREETAHAAVLGHIALLGIWASRDTEDGTIPGDGVAVMRHALSADPKTARIILDVLTAADVDLIHREDGKLRLRGFKDAYGPLMRKRAGDAERLAKWRARNATGNAACNALHNGDVNASRNGSGNALRTASPDRTVLPLPLRGLGPRRVRGRNSDPPAAWWGEGQFDTRDPTFVAAVGNARDLQPIDRHERATGQVVVPDIDRAAAAFVEHVRRRAGDSRAATGGGA